MTKAARKAIAEYRRRARHKGLVRIEVQVPRQDAASLKSVAGLLRNPDPAVAERVRHGLRGVVHGPLAPMPLKALLESAPLEGVEFERPRDFGRKVEL